MIENRREIPVLQQKVLRRAPGRDHDSQGSEGSLQHSRRNQTSYNQRAPAGICASDRSEKGSLQKLPRGKAGYAGAAEGQTERGAVLW